MASPACPEPTRDEYLDEQVLHEDQTSAPAAADQELAVNTVPRDLRKETVSPRHLLTHEPKNLYCPVCRKAKLRRKRHERVRDKGRPKIPIRQLTADHIY